MQGDTSTLAVVASGLRSRVRVAVAGNRGGDTLARRAAELTRYALRRPHEADFAAFALFPERTGLFLDVGANTGASALSFRIYNRRSPILSIEPNPMLAPGLRRLK